MSYQDKLDKKKSIQNAKKELEDFSDLFKLHQDNFPDIQGVKYGNVPTIASYINADQRILDKIEKKDEQLQFINKILEAISKLDDDELQVIFCKYILMKNNKQLEHSLNMSYRTVLRKLTNAYFNIAIALGLEILERNCE